MELHFIITLLVFIVLTILLLKESLPAEVTIFSALIVLLLFNVISVEEAFEGFSNTGMLTIALLFIVAGSILSTGAIDRIINIVIQKTKNTSYQKVLLFLLSPIVLLSAFMNNTPIVAMSIPGIKSWAEKNNKSSSKILIPVSYASILGGMITLIGTSTNLIVHGLMIEHTGYGFGFFELTKIGLPLAFAGLVYLLIYGHKLLPESLENLDKFSANTQKYVVEFKVNSKFSGINSTVEKCGLRHLSGLYLFQILRESEIISPISNKERIHVGDRLFFTGLPKSIIELQKREGLEIIEDIDFDIKNYDSDKVKAYEAVISRSSGFIGKTVKELDFRSNFNAVVLAVNRAGERVEKKIGDVKFQIGDSLLLLSDRSFYRKYRYSNEFSLVAYSDEIPSKPIWKIYLAFGTFFFLLLLSILGILPLITAMSLVVILLIGTKTISRENAIKSVDWKVLLIIASSFGIAKAVENSGVGVFFANYIIEIFKPIGVIGLIGGVYILTTIYTNFITNNTAAILMFPLVYPIAVEMNMNIMPFAVAIAIGASSSFATPISYQTNMMVYGPGNYKFKDFIKIGLPLQLIVGVLAILLIKFYYL